MFMPSPGNYQNNSHSRCQTKVQEYQRILTQPLLSPQRWYELRELFAKLCNLSSPEQNEAVVNLNIEDELLQQQLCALLEFDRIDRNE